MISKFLYHNFKCFKEAELSIEYITTLIGTNSSGKTNAIEGMMILSEIVTGIDLTTILDGSKNNNGGVRGGAHGCSRFNGDTFALGCVVQYDEAIDLKYEIRLNVKDRVVVEEETLTEITYKVKGKKNKPNEVKIEKIIFSTKPSSFDSGDISVSINNGQKGRNPDINCIKYYASIGQVESKLSTETKYGKITVEYCRCIIDNLKNILYLSPEPSLMRSYSAVGDTVLKVNASNLSSVLYHLCEDCENKKTLLEIMKQLPENEVTDISFAEGPLNDVILFLEEKYGKMATVEKMNAKQLSDGTLRCLAIVAAILSEKEHGTIVIEEIDNGIHPGRAKQLIHVLSELALARKVDLIFSTHNPTLLNALTKRELHGVNLIYRSDDSGDGCIIPLVDIKDVPVLLTNGKLGDVFVDDKILEFVKKDADSADLSWLGV